MKILISASNMVHINNFHLPYIEALKKEGHQVYVMARGEGADYNIDFKKRSLSLKNYKLSFEIKRIIKNEGFDVIFLHTSLAAFWVRMALKGLKNRPYVFNMVHGYLFGKSSGKLHNLIYLSCEKLLKKQTDDICVMNGEDYDIATKNKLCKGNVYFSNGMGVDFSKGKADKERAENEKINLTFVGEISKRKNQMLLVKAMKRLENYTLTLVGDGDEREKIEKYIKKNGLEDRVHITGFKKNIYDYINKADIYVSASKIEGLPFNIMEAMNLGKPIVASDIKGHKDLLDKECLFKLDNIDDYIRLVKNKELRDIKYSLEKYEFNNAFSENMAIYRSALEVQSKKTLLPK